MNLYRYSQTKGTFFNIFTKSASFALAFLLAVGSFGEVSFADNAEEVPWVYDSARVEGAVSVSNRSGDYNEVYSLELPKGVDGLTPDIKLSYSSQSGYYGSYIGYGWNLNIPSIERVNKSGVDKLYSKDDYTSSFDGELVKTNSTTYRPLVEPGNFKSYEKTNNIWKVFDLDKTEYIFGSTSAERQDDVSSSTKIFSWFLSEVRDPNGNKIVYEYSKINGQIYPKKILYAFDMQANPVAEVRFVYSSTTPYTSFKTGFYVINEQVLEKIEVFFDGKLVSAYDLVYKNANASSIKLLSSIKKTSYNEGGTMVSVPPRTFEYTEHDSVNWIDDNSIATTAPTHLYNEKITPSPYKQYYYRDLLIDINGDSLVDWIDDDVVYLNNGNGWELSSSWPTLPKDKWHLDSRLVDINGDFLPDIVTSLLVINTDTSTTGTKSIMINQGDGSWVSDADWASTIPEELFLKNFFGSYSEYKREVYFVDMNGDGLVDWLNNGRVYLNTGTGWDSSQSWPTLPSGEDDFDKKYRLGDINGDSLPDIVRADHYLTFSDVVYTKQVFMNNGNGTWVLDERFKNSMPETLTFYGVNYTNGNEYIYYRYLTDINGDGLADLLADTTAYLNQGSEWSTSSAVSLPVNTKKLVKGYRLFDIDGDGMLDFLRSDIQSYVSTVYTYKNAFINEGSLLWLLSTSTNEYGGVSSVTYDVTTKKENNKLTNPNLPIVKYVVSQIKKISEFVPDITITYSHYDGDFFYSSTTNRKFAGFGKVTKTTDLGKEISYYHQGNNVATTTEEGVDDKALIGQIYRTEVTDLNDNLFQLNRYNFATTSLGNDSKFVKLESELQMDYDGDGDEKVKATSYTYSNTHGSPLTITEHGEVDGSTDGTFTDTGSDKRTTEYEYATNANGLVLPSKQTLKDNSGTKVQESRFYYDNQALGNVTLGNMTKQEDWVSGSNYVDKQWTYNSLGLVTSETDPEGNTSYFDYDQYNLFVASTTNALGHNTQYEYDYSSGQVATTTDPNGNVFATTYDGFGRPLSVTVPDPQTGAPVIQTEYVYTDTAGEVSVQRIDHLNSELSHNSYSFLDGFGRVIQEREEAENTNEYVVRDYIYGDNGHLEKESLPYFSTGASSTNATTNADLLSSYTYDALGRVVAVGTVVGTTTTSYDQWQEIVTDTAGNDKGFEYDAFGRLVKVTEDDGSGVFTTQYTWSSLDDLTKITDAEGNVRNIEYDGLSRRTSLEDLHDPNDTSYGVWDFAYDDAGNMTQKTDPSDNTINYTYDALNRQLTENYTGEAGTEVTYTYDTCTGGEGQLCSVANSSVTTSYTYTLNNLLASESKTIDSTTYTTDYEYDYQGNQILITHPDDSEVKYTYHKGGQIDKVEQRESGDAFANVIENVDYGPHGQMENIEYGNGTKTTRTYDTSELYRLSNILTTATSTYGTGGPGEELALVEAELASLTTEEGASEVPGEITPEAIEEISSETGEEDVISEISEIDTSDESTDLEDETEAEDQEVVEKLVREEDVIATTSNAETTTEEELADTVTNTEVATGTDSTTTSAATTSAPTSSLDVIPAVIPAKTNTTPEISEKVIKEVKTKSKIKLPIKNAHDARMWQKYYEERLAGLKNKKNIDKKALASAEYSKDQIEAYLVEEKYVKKKGDSVKGHAKEYVERKGKKFLEKVKDVILPATAESYLFDTEDFEGCSSIPCTFDSDVSWGNVTPSLDSSGQIEGDDSLKETVTGSGGGGLEFSGQNEDEIYVQFKVYIPSNMAWGASGYHNILQLNDSSDNSIFWLTVEDWGTARLTMMGDALAWTDTGLDLTKGTVNTIEVRFKKGSTNGDVDIWLDNTTEGSPDYDGSGSLNTGTDNVDDVQIGVTYAPEAISTTYFDDVVIDTAFIGTLTSGGGSNPSPTVPFVETVQDLTYTYDSVGNITKIVDDSETDSAVTIDYTYDDLYRLISASTTNASTTPYTESYTYSSIGNILTKSDVGTYTYEGDQGGGSSYVLYDEAVATGWADWSWWTTLNPSNTSPVQAGTYSLSATYSQPWAGISYHHNNFDSSPYDDLELSVYTTTSTNLYFYLTDSNGTPHQIVELKDYVTGGTLTTNTWHNLTIPLSDLDYENYQGATEMNIETSATSTIYLDNIKFTGGSGGGDNYANPHAATTIGGGTQTYDENGNLLSTPTTENTWNYRNELTQSVQNNATTTYAYDHTGQRVKKDNGTAVTYYPFGNYEVKDGKVTKHLYLNNTLVATIEEDTPTPSIYYNHVDHLNSTNAVTDKDGYLNQVLSYQPYGSTRIDNQYDIINQTKRYTGHDYDESTGLNYMKARYQSGEEGRFVSQDPANLDVPQQFLYDPQQLNTYSYGRNNPVIYNDPTGESPVLIAALVAAGFSAAYYSSNRVEDYVNDSVNRMLARASRHDSAEQYNQSILQISNQSSTWDAAISNPELAGAAVGITSGAAIVPAIYGLLNLTTIEVGVSYGYIGRMSVGASAYGYLSYNALHSTSDMVTSYSQFDFNNQNTWWNPIYNTGLMYGPRAFGEPGESVYQIGEINYSLYHDYKSYDNED